MGNVAVCCGIAQFFGGLDFACGEFTVKGARDNQEDAFAFESKGNTKCFVLLDGHLDSRCSKRAAQLLPAELLKLENWTTKSVQEAFIKVNKRIFKENIQSGTCVVALIISTNEDGTHRACVAHLGDSRVVLTNRDGTIIHETTDDKPNKAPHYERIVAAGGSVFNGRVNGVLAIPAAFGDSDYTFFKKDADAERCDWDPDAVDADATAHLCAVTCVPTVNIFDLPKDACAYMFCDGLTEKCSGDANTQNKAIIAAGMKYPNDPRAGAVKMCFDAIDDHTGDNCSAAVIQLGVDGRGKFAPQTLIPDKTPDDNNTHKYKRGLAEVFEIDYHSKKTAELDAKYEDALKIRRKFIQHPEDPLEVFMHERCKQNELASIEQRLAELKLAATNDDSSAAATSDDSSATAVAAAVAAAVAVSVTNDDSSATAVAASVTNDEISDSAVSSVDDDSSATAAAAVVAAVVAASSTDDETSGSAVSSTDDSSVTSAAATAAATAAASIVNAIAVNDEKEDDTVINDNDSDDEKEADTVINDNDSNDGDHSATVALSNFSGSESGAMVRVGSE
jgi:serine/threonine protein phosphatase PrpC